MKIEISYLYLLITRILVILKDTIKTKIYKILLRVIYTISNSSPTNNNKIDISKTYKAFNSNKYIILILTIKPLVKIPLKLKIKTNTI